MCRGKLVQKFNWVNNMSNMKIIVLALLLITTSSGFISCTTAPTKQTMQSAIQQTPEEEAVRKIEKFFYLNDREMFNSEVLKFAKEYPNSTYKLYISLLNSRQMFLDNRLTEALEVNKFVQTESFNTNKKIYYESLFYSSDIYESLGKLDNSLAVLVECEKNHLMLSDRIRLFELPLKLSVAYARLSQSELSLNYMKKTESGLKEFLSKENHSKKTLSEIYYEIGSGVLSPSFLDYYTDANKFSIVFRYLIYCLNLNENPYSEKSKNQLMLQLKSLWEQVQTDAVPSTGDRLEDEKIRFDKLTNFSKLLNSIQLLEPLEEKQINAFQKEFFTYLSEVQKQTFNEIYSQYKYTPPTDESFRHRVFRDQLKTEDVENKKQ